MSDNHNATSEGASMPPFSDIEDIIADIRAGKMVIMVDDENRENEGDLIMAAEKVRPEDINYMATHGRGLICLTLSRERCEQLRLPLMVSDTDHASRAPTSRLSIEAAEGITTGISAHDRARTIQAAVAPGCQAGRPEPARTYFSGHGATRRRADASRPHRGRLRSCPLAGLEPAAAIVEILNEDGSMARRPGP